MAAKSEYAILRILPGESGMIVAETGLENVRDSKSRAQELATKNPGIAFVPAVLYEPSFAKEIHDTQITDAPENVLQLLGLIDNEPSGSPEPEKPDGDDKGDGDDKKDDKEDADKPEDTADAGGDSEENSDEGSDESSDGESGESSEAEATASANQSAGELF